LPKLPYYLAADQWRLEVLNNNVTNVTELNESWRRYRSVNNVHRVWEIGTQLYSLLTLALRVGGVVNTMSPANLPSEEPWCRLQRRLVVPQGQPGRYFHQGSNPEPSSP